MSDSADVMIGKCNAFNELHPVGSQVVYINDLGEIIKTKVKAEAQILCGHTPIVFLDGVRGGYALDRVIG
ncbi:MAG: hypothetical protein GWN94_10540 [Phycisphaerae bacterium]|nr:hypothetical protein [Phycisphaerae bacterium]NIS51528.1 hypothetical protein [Phycisphaerae bacterium]